MFFELIALAIFIATTVFNIAPDNNGKTSSKITAPVRSNVPENKSAVSDWVEVFKTNQMILYADPAGLRKEGSMVKMWRLTDYKAPEINGDFVYLSKKLYEEYDCKKEQYRLLSVSLYHQNMGVGKTMYIHSEIYSWEPILRDTEAEAMWEIACEQN